MTRVALAALALLVAQAALAWDLRVDDAGGPSDLAERVARAESAWRDAGLDVDAVARTVLVRYDDGSLLGPDAYGIVVTGGPPGIDLEVIVDAEAAQLDDALLITLGIALGGRSGEGLLAAGLAVDGLRAPSPDDVASLFRTSAPGDVTGDGVVGFADLLAIAAAWGTRGVNLAADLDGDGVVGPGDVTSLEGDYVWRSLGAPPPPDAADDDADDADVGDDADEADDGDEADEAE